MAHHDADLDDGMNIKPGDVISSVKSSFVVIKLLGKGGFGAVYKVYDQEDKTKMFAMKIEKKLETRKHSKLKMEVAILKMVSETRSPEKSHFTAIVDRGKKEKFFFLVMQLVGMSLDDLKKQRPNRVFSIGTGIGAGYQCLESIEDLTKCGFIHRDIKPANYACGLADKKHMVYLLDFGIARRILNDENELKTPRALVGFKGTVKFASLSCHRNIELGPKDDCESWFYLLLDLIMLGGLPWRRISDKNDVLKMKEECHKDKVRFIHGLNRCQETLGRIIDYIDSLTYSDHVDYAYIYKSLLAAGTDCNVDIHAAYDWEHAENEREQVRTFGSDNTKNSQTKNSSTRKMSVRTARFN